MKKFLILLFLIVGLFSYSEEVLVTTIVGNSPGTNNPDYNYWYSSSLSSGEYRAVINIPSTLMTFVYIQDVGATGSAGSNIFQNWRSGTFERTFSLTSNKQLCLCLGNDLAGRVTVQIYKTVVGSPPVITSATSLSKTAGEAFSYTITATGTTPIYYTISTSNPLPAYLTLSGNTITGTLPVSSQDYIFFFDVIATNEISNDMKRVTVNVNAAGRPVWANSITLDHFIGETVNYDVNDWIVEGKPITSFHAVTSIPFGLSFVNNHVTGTISGTPGTATFELSATNDIGTANKTITINVGGGAPVYTGPIPPVIIVNKGASFSANLLNNWSNATIVTMGNLPSWASVSNNILSGTVPESEIRERITGITMHATNQYPGLTGDVTGVEFHIIGAGTDQFYFTSPSTSHAVIGQPFSYQASTNQSGVTYSLTSGPSWLSCTSSGAVSGTVPDGVTGFTFTVSASHVEFGSISLTVQVSAGTSNEDGSGTAQHVIVDNFEDFGSTGFAQGVNSQLSQLNQNTSSIKSGIDSLIAQEKITRDSLSSLNHLEGIHNDTTSINSQLGGIGSKLDEISNKIPSTGAIESKLDNIANILQGFGVDTDEILAEQKKQTGILEDIRDAMSVPESMPDMSVSYNSQIHTSDIDIPVLGSQLNRSFSSVAPVITMPFSAMHASIPDITWDFSRPELYNTISRLRVFEIGCVVIWCLVLIFKTIRTFEF